MDNLYTLTAQMQRWRVLRVIQSGGAVGVPESLIEIVLEDVELPATRQEIREILRYLADSGYCELHAPRYSVWRARILPKGTCYLENKEEEDAGIRRPAAF